MRIGVRFSPPEGVRAGSQHTIAHGLIPQLYKLHPDIVLFTSNPGAFDPAMQVYPSREFGKSKSLQGAAFERIADQFHFERALKRHKCDLVYYPYTHESLLLTFKVPQVITVHDLLPVLYPEFYPLMSKQWRYFTIPSLKHAKKIIAVSQNTKMDIIRFTGISEDKIHVVGNGFRSFLKSSETILYNNKYGKYLLYVCSSHYPHKNLLNLFTAYKKVVDAVPHKLIVVGKSIHRFAADITKSTETLDLGERLLFFEDIGDEHLFDLYRHADLFVYPSLYEGFGIPVLEAMSHSIPVVASNAASIPEVCGDAALYFDPNSPHAIAEAIMKGITDHTLRQNLVLKGRIRVKIFQWETTAKRILEVCASAA